MRLRPATADDQPFLLALYADRRAEEMAALGWSPEQGRAFVEMQFRAQQEGYDTRFPGADCGIVLADDERVGRLLVDRGPEEHRLVDIVVLRSHRGAGIGSGLLRDVLAEAGAAGVPVRLSVDASRPALVAWYRRLGFTVSHHGPMDLGMIWEPGH